MSEKQAAGGWTVGRHSGIGRRGFIGAGMASLLAGNLLARSGPLSRFPVCRILIPTGRAVVGPEGIQEFSEERECGGLAVLVGL